MIENNLPHNPEAERKVLGAMMRDPAAVAKARDVLTGGDFYIPTHRTIFESICELTAKDGHFDLTCLADELERIGKFEEVGGAATLIELAGSVATSASIGHHAAIVREKAIRRRIIRNASQQAQEAVNADLDVLSARAYADALSIVPDSKVAGFRRIGEFLDRTIETIEARMKRKSSGRAYKDVQTGIIDFDRRFGGLNRGELAILAARPSEGKSALAAQIALSVAETGAVGFVSCEMSGEEILGRTLITQHGADDGETAKNILRRANELQRLNLYFDDSPGVRVDQLVARSERLKIELGKLDLLVIDYLQLLRCPNDMNRLSRFEKVTFLSGECKSLARRLDSPLLLLSQLSRDCDKEARPPRLSDLRESGSIEQDADIVAFIHRPAGVERGASGIRELSIQKNRSGPTGEIRLIFDSENLQFNGMSSRDYPDEAVNW